MLSLAVVIVVVRCSDRPCLVIPRLLHVCFPRFDKHCHGDHSSRLGLKSAVASCPCEVVLVIIIISVKAFIILTPIVVVVISHQ